MIDNSTDDDDGVDLEEWDAMSDEQQEAELSRQMDRYAEWYNTLTPLQQYRHRRRRGLRTCLGWRRSIKRMDAPIFREHLHTSQRLLLKMRADYFHGVQGGIQ